MPRYKLALLPQDPQLGADITAYAQRLFLPHSNGYILGEHALPHITLCQFDAKFEQLTEIWFANNHLLPTFTTLSFFGLQLRHTGDTDDDVLWAEISIKREPSIVNAQRQIVASLVERMITLHTLPGEGYHPHITLARIYANAVVRDVSLVPEHMWATPHTFELSVGLCNELGVLQERVF